MKSTVYPLVSSQWKMWVSASNCHGRPSPLAPIAAGRRSAIGRSAEEYTYPLPSAWSEYWLSNRPCAGTLLVDPYARYENVGTSMAIFDVGAVGRTMNVAW